MFLLFGSSLCDVVWLCSGSCEILAGSLHSLRVNCALGPLVIESPLVS